MALVVALAILIIGLAAGAAYLFFVSPNLALGKYLQRLADSKTSVFAGNASASSDGTDVTVTVDGKEDVHDANKPKIQATLKGELKADKGSVVTAGAESGSLSGQIILTDNTVYFKLDSFSVLSQLLPVKLSNDWYKYALGNENSKCTSTAKDSGSFLGSDFVTNIPIKNNKFTGFDKFDGTNALHYTGTLDNSKLKTVIDNANKNLSADCKLDFTADDFKNLSVTYELWRGWSKDRLSLNFVDTSDPSSKVTSSLTLDTGSYNEPVTVTAPANAKDASELVKDLTGDATSTSNPNDTARKNDMARLAATVEEYASTHKGVYPATAAILSKQGFTGTDPETKKPYAIVATPPTTVGQIEYVLSAKCDVNATTAVSVKPVDNTFYALVAKLDEGTTTCSDNQ
jgi:hypothetical protein